MSLTWFSMTYGSPSNPNITSFELQMSSLSKRSNLRRQFEVVRLEFEIVVSLTDCFSALGVISVWRLSKISLENQ